MSLIASVFLSCCLFFVNGTVIVFDYGQKLGTTMQENTSLYVYIHVHVYLLICLAVGNAFCRHHFADLIIPLQYLQLKVSSPFNVIVTC